MCVCIHKCSCTLHTHCIYCHQLIVLFKVSLYLYSIQQAANPYKASQSKHASNQDISKQTLADYGRAYHTASYTRAPRIANSYNDVLFQQHFRDCITTATDTSRRIALLRG